MNLKSALHGCAFENKDSSNLYESSDYIYVPRAWDNLRNQFDFSNQPHLC